MSTVVAIQTSKFAVLASDNRLVSDDRKYHAPAMAAKLKPVGEYLLGYAGDHRAGQLAHYVFKPPALIDINNQSELDWFISNHFIPELRQTWEDNNCNVTEDTLDLIVAIRGIIYWVGSDYSWIREDSGLYGVGSGGKYALGYLSAHTIPATQARIETLACEAIGSASYFDVNTSDNAIIYHQTIPKGWQ